MKSHELVERINNGEIKDGTKIKCILKGRQLEVVRLCGDTLQFENGDYPKANMFLIPNAEFEMVEEKGWFKPKCGEFYFVINAFGGINFSKWANSETDLYAYNRHNCFKTAAEAQECLDYNNALEEAKKPFVYKKFNYYIHLECETKELSITWGRTCKTLGVTYLGQDKEVAQAFIDKWKKQILKYEFGIFE